MIDDQQYKIVNIDTLILAEEPKLTPFKDKIKESMISILKLKPDQLNIKASTSEGKGPIGRKESIAAYAVALIDKK
jgi:2-C-methyl-D-erythritol 2,4-cyclodiphosphate synthase